MHLVGSYCYSWLPFHEPVRVETWQRNRGGCPFPPLGHKRAMIQGSGEPLEYARG